MANLLSWGFDKLKGGVQTVNRDVLHPVEHAAGNVIHAGGNVVHAVEAAPTVVNRDVVQPILNTPQTFRNDVVAPVQRDVVRPLFNAPQTINNDLFHPIQRIPLGNGVTAGSFVSSLPKANADFWKAAPLAAVRTGEGLAQGVVDTPAFVYNAADTIANKVTGNKGIQLPGQSAVNTATNYVNKPFNYLGGETDKAAQNLGLNMTAYHAAQVPANIAATLINPKSVVNDVKKAAVVAEKGAKAATPTATLHRTLLEKNPGYAALQERLDGSTAAANKINQNGGSKVALDQHLKNIDNIQQQMAEMRRKASTTGSLNPDYSSITPEGNSLPKRTSVNPRLPKTQSSASKEILSASSKNSVTPGVPKTATPEQIGKALGMSDEQMSDAMATEKATLDTRLQSPRARQLKRGLPHSQSRTDTIPNAAQPSRVNPAQSSRRSSSQKGVVSDSSATKYTTNTKKVKIATVNPADYQKVRSNAQLVQSVVHNHAQSVIHALRKVPEAERKEFWHKVEDPSLPRSKAMQEAISRWHELSDTVHATSQALGGDTPYRVNYARHNWDLSDPEQAALFEQLMKQRVKDSNYSPQDFKGLDSKPRVFDTIKQGEAMGFKLKNADPISDVAEYAQKSKNQLKTQAVAKGMAEAEADIPASAKSETQSIGYKKSIETTKRGVHELRSLYPSAKSTNPVLGSYRKINKGAKQFLLSISQFHPININLQAAPALALKGHPVLAIRGLVDSAAAISKKYSDHIMQKALHDGTLEDAARIGTPIATGSDFGLGGAMDIKGRLGERMIFERQLPAMHVQMVRGVVSDLKKRGISLDSTEARKAGNTINEIMGYVNTELRNLSPTVQRGLGDALLAPQFTRSKWQILGDAFTKGGQAGSYARRAVIGKYAAEAAITLAVGAVLGQKSDNFKDVLVRTLLHPSIPTPFKDSKGNTLELGLPHNYISEAGNLLGSVKRGTNGRLGVSVDPAQIPGNLRDYGKGRLAIVPNDALKVATNTDFADKPLYNPTSPLKDQLAQSATTLLTGHLPIGLQGVVHTKPIERLLPKNVQQVLNASNPGTSPIAKSAGSAIGLNLRTDKTVGKGQQTTQYFEALDKASQGLNRQEKDALDLYTGGKKNPVTGQYEIKPNVNDSRAKASVLLQNPKVIDRLISMNQVLAKQGQQVDPLWQQSKDKIVSYLQYQAMPPGGADKTDWHNKNQWYTAVANQRNSFFNSLPKGDPNKPQNPYTYPDPSPQVQKDMNTYNSLANSTAKGTFLDNHPNVIKQWDAVANYNNEMRAALGYAPLKSYPEPSKDVQSFMDSYNATDKTARKSLRNANPSQYQKMIAYYDQLDLYNINKQGALSQLQGEPDYTNTSAKDIKNIGEDFYVDQFGNYHLIPAGWMLGLGGDGSGKAPATPAQARLRFSLARKAPKVVGSNTSTPKLATPSFTSGLATVYHPKMLSKTPTVSIKKSKFGIA